VGEVRDNTVGLYVSVPFCRAKCSFCNFASGVGSGEAVERYVDQLCGEIAGAAERARGLGAELSRDVDTVYFGGGTPSLLTPGQLERVFAALRGEFDLRGNAEITMEAAPGQIGDEVLEAAMRLGVNRVSLGVQSFVDRESAAVGRLHTGDSCLAEIARLRAAGVEDVGADLIAGLPYQTRESWAYSLEAAEGAGLTHLSVYMLEIDEESRLGREVLGGGARMHAPAVGSEELAAELYEMACERLPAAGFGQYEISNFAPVGFESKHNRKYWQRAPYLGFGLDAHSMLRASLSDGCAVRFANADELREYDGTRTLTEVTRVDLDAAFEEAVFLGLRMVCGVSVEALCGEFGRERVAGCEPTVRELVDGGLMVVEDGRWKLTVRGRLVSSEVFGRLLVVSAV
jgi:oxygen-independent coproporphyrinogen III oxidase